MTLRSMWVLTGSNSRHNRVAYFGRSNTPLPQVSQAPGAVMDFCSGTGQNLPVLCSDFTKDFVIVQDGKLKDWSDETSE